MQLSSRLEDSKFPDIKLSDNCIPDLSIISEENSHIPTELCTSADEMKSDYEHENSLLENVSESQVGHEYFEKIYTNSF